VIINTSSIQFSSELVLCRNDEGIRKRQRREKKITQRVTVWENFCDEEWMKVFKKCVLEEEKETGHNLDEDKVCE